MIRARRRSLALAILRFTICLTALLAPFLGPSPRNWGACTSIPQRWGPYLSQECMVAICIVAFVSGHLLSNLDPAHRSQRPRIDPALNRRLPITPEDLVVGFLMLVATSLVLYEWYAMVNSRSLVAITYYVRCANVIANYRTMAMAAAFTFVVGTWLRFPWWRS